MPIILFISVQYYVQAFCYSEWRPWSPHDSVSLPQASRQARGHRTQGTFKSKHGNLTNTLFSHNNILYEILLLYIIISVSTCLQHTLDAMLERAGVASNLKDSDLKGPTEVREGEREGEREGWREGGREGERDYVLKLMLWKWMIETNCHSIFPQMHNLLELVQKEQAIYNICFHELIRQVSVQCVERGELLASIRKRYSNLLDRIPRQVKR